MADEPDRYRGLRFFDRTAAAEPPREGPCARQGEPEERPRLASGGARHELIDWLLRRAGLAPEAYRAQPLERRLPACLRQLRAVDAAEARRRVERDPSLIAPALNSLLIGYTTFFRDPAVFEQIERAILPEFLAGGRGLRAWSVGCAAGAELYSLAILLDRAGALEPSVLLGTDCRADAVDRAAPGWFAAADCSALDAPVRERFFDRAGEGYRVVARLRSRVHWAVADAVSSASAVPQTGGLVWDLILCRNLAIYLEQGPARSLWHHLAAALRPGGVLVTGKAERPPREEGLSRIAHCIYRKKGGPDDNAGATDRP